MPTIIAHSALIAVSSRCFQRRLTHPIKSAAVNAANEVGWTALIMAAWKGLPEVAQVLLAKGANVNAKTNNHGTALIVASEKGQSEVVSCSLQRVPM